MFSSAHTPSYFTKSSWENAGESNFDHEKVFPLFQILGLTPFSKNFSGDIMEHTGEFIDSLPTKSTEWV